jgi:hypothetical protein
MWDSKVCPEKEKQNLGERMNFYNLGVERQAIWWISEF